MRRITCIVLICLSLILAGCVAATEHPSESVCVPSTVATPTQTEETAAAPTAVSLPEHQASPETTQETTQDPTQDTGSFLGTVAPSIEPMDTDLVCVTEYIPTIDVELKYATEDNFTGTVIYDFTSAYLRYGTVKKLAKVQEELLAQGLCLKIWDGFRPVAAQFSLWEAYPVDGFVANPNNGYSSHSRGNTVDITLVDQYGAELVMPTEFDSFSSLADRNYEDCSEEAKTNALLLELIMIKHGFKAYSEEWWHFTDVDSYPVEESFVPEELTQ